MERRARLVVGATLAVLVVGAIAAILGHLDQGGGGDQPRDAPAPRAGSTPVTADRTRGADVGAAEGYAAGVTGGLGGDVYWVTSLEDDGHGTLRRGLETSDGPRWIRFRTSGRISLETPLEVPSDTTLDGRGERIELTAARDVTALQLTGVRNVIIHNLILFGDKATRSTSGQPRSDAINILGGDRIWIDHNTMSGWGDKLIDMSLVDRATVSYNAFQDAAPGHGILIGTRSTASQLDDTAVTVHHNTFRKIPDRSPRIGDGGRAHVYNNYVEGWSYYGMKAIRGAQLLAENNVFGPADSADAISATEDDSPPGDVRADGNLLLDDSLRIEQHNPNAVFTPRYSYTLEPATTSLRDRLLVTTGWTG